MNPTPGSETTRHSQTALSRAEMGRRRVELRPIQDKNKRQITFSKRRQGLMKKAQELSVLCDVDVALAVFTSGCRAYKFSGGNSFNMILERYRTHIEANSGNSNDHQPEKHQQECRTPCENNNILQSVQRFFESQAVEQLDISLLARLEHFLDAKLAQTRSRKTQLMMESLAALHEKERRLREEKLISEMINEMQTEGMINGEDNQEPTVELYNQWANNNNYPSD